jgi:hypothetical protein
MTGYICRPELRDVETDLVSVSMAGRNMILHSLQYCMAVAQAASLLYEYWKSELQSCHIGRNPMKRNPSNVTLQSELLSGLQWPKQNGL